MMERRKLGRTGIEVGAVGIGTEHLQGQPRETVVSVIRAAVDRGVDYFDVLWCFPEYLDNLGAAFRGRRADVTLTLHVGCDEQDGQYQLTRDPEVCAANFEEMLSRLGTDHADAIMMQWVDEDSDFARARETGGLLELAARLVGQGKGRFVGISSHNALTSEHAVRSGAVDVLMFPINPGFDAISAATGIAAPDALDERPRGGPAEPDPARRGLYELCAAHQVGLVAMKPFAGGRFFHLSDEARGGLTPVRLLSYALSQPGVSTAVPGVKSSEELDVVLRYVDASVEDRAFGPELAASSWRLEGRCVFCNHCLPCPSGIDVGRTLRLLAVAERAGASAVRAEYETLPAKASECTECGVCAERCPFGVDAVAEMRRAAEVFEG